MNAPEKQVEAILGIIGKIKSSVENEDVDGSQVWQGRYQQELEALYRSCSGESNHLWWHEITEKFQKEHQELETFCEKLKKDLTEKLIEIKQGKKVSRAYLSYLD